MIPTRIHRHTSIVRTLVAAAALLASGAVSAGAQSSTDSTTVRKQAQAMRDRLAAAGGLELTPEQRTKLSAITNKHADEGKAIGELFQSDPDAAMKHMVALRAKMQAEVRAVLTPDQRTIFDRNVAEMNAQMNAHFPTAPH